MNVGKAITAAMQSQRAADWQRMSWDIGYGTWMRQFTILGWPIIKGGSVKELKL